MRRYQMVAARLSLETLDVGHIEATERIEKELGRVEQETVERCREAIQALIKERERTRRNDFHSAELSGLRQALACCTSKDKQDG